MYKVFINSSALFISKTPLLLQEGEEKKVQHIPFENTKTFTRLLPILEQNDDTSVIYNVFGEDLPLLWRKFKKHYELVLAGGGVVRNAKNKILFIYRHNRWDLPKGKAETGESIEETALREVMEECGIEHLYMIDFLCDTYHTYGSKTSRKLKKTCWFRMYTEDKNTQPQLDEDITAVKWIKEEKLYKALANTFPSIIDVLQAELAVKTTQLLEKKE